MTPGQPGILLDVPAAARYLTLGLVPGAEPKHAVELLAAIEIDESLVVALGPQLVAACSASVPGLREAPALAGVGVAFPSTPAGLWVWLRGSDRGALLHASRDLKARLAPAFRIAEVTDAFRFDVGRDLTGYEDGTENPTGDDAVRTAFTAAEGRGLDGSSFVAVQRWVHDLDGFFALPPGERDHTIGRRRSDNLEIDDAPDSAHVKRTAQEDFEPAAFVVRRSMPWSDPHGEGLVFVAFGASFDAFEALQRRMAGLDDGIVDALFRFTRPVSSSFFWCPPVRGGRLDLSALG